MKTIDGLREKSVFKEGLPTASMPALLIALVLLSACAGQAPKGASGLNMNLAGYPPAFKSGYSDGCNSAAGTRKKDTARFNADVQYAQGWRDGFDVCKRR